MYICIYPSASYIHIHLYIHFYLPTYLPSVPQPSYYQQKKASSIDHCFLFFPSPPRPARVRICMYIYELMEGFSSLSCPILFELRPVRPPPFPPRKKRRSLRRLRPPLPCDGSSHIQSQLDKARQRQDKARQATCLPAKELRKK